MKKLFLITLALGLVLGASAQRYKGGSYRFSGPRFGLSMGVPMYPYYGYGYSPFGFPPAYYGYQNSTYRPSKLDLKIEDIKSDYKDRIWSVRHDETLTGKQRRKEVRDLKHERDMAVENTRKNYYKAKQN